MPPYAPPKFNPKNLGKLTQVKTFVDPLKPKLPSWIGNTGNAPSGESSSGSSSGSGNHSHNRSNGAIFSGSNQNASQTPTIETPTIPQIATPKPLTLKDKLTNLVTQNPFQTNNLNKNNTLNYIPNGTSKFGGGVVAQGNMIVTNPYNKKQVVIKDTDENIKNYNNLIDKINTENIKKTNFYNNVFGTTSPSTLSTITSNPLDLKITQQDEKKVNTIKIPILNNVNPTPMFTLSANNNKESLIESTDKSIIDNIFGTNFFTIQKLTNAKTKETYTQTAYNVEIFRKGKKSYTVQNGKLVELTKEQYEQANKQMANAISERVGTFMLTPAPIQKGAIIIEKGLFSAAISKINNFVEKNINPITGKIQGTVYNFRNNFINDLKIIQKPKVTITPSTSIYEETTQKVVLPKYSEDKLGLVGKKPTTGNITIKDKYSSYDAQNQALLTNPNTHVTMNDKLIIKESTLKSIFNKPVQKIESSSTSEKIFLQNKKTIEENKIINENARNQLSISRKTENNILGINNTKTESRLTIVESKVKTIKPILTKPREPIRITLDEKKGNYTTIYKTTNPIIKTLRTGERTVEYFGKKGYSYPTSYGKKINNIFEAPNKSKKVYNYTTNYGGNNKPIIKMPRSGKRTFEFGEGGLYQFTTIYKNNIKIPKPQSNYKLTIKILTIPKNNSTKIYNNSKQTVFNTKHSLSKKIILPGTNIQKTSIYGYKNASKVNLPNYNIIKPKNKIIEGIKNDFKQIHLDKRATFKPQTILKTETTETEERIKPTIINDYWKGIQTTDDEIITTSFKPKPIEYDWRKINSPTKNRIKIYNPTNRGKLLITGLFGKTIINKAYDNTLINISTNTLADTLTNNPTKTSTASSTKIITQTQTVIIPKIPEPIIPQIRLINDPLPLEKPPTKPIIPKIPEYPIITPPIPIINFPGLGSGLGSSGSGKYNKYGVKNKIKLKNIYTKHAQIKFFKTSNKRRLF